MFSPLTHGSIDQSIATTNSHRRTGVATPCRTRWPSIFGWGGRRERREKIFSASRYAIRANVWTFRAMAGDVDVWVVNADGDAYFSDSGRSDKSNSSAKSKESRRKKCPVPNAAPAHRRRSVRRPLGAGIGVGWRGLGRGGQGGEQGGKGGEETITSRNHVVRQVGTSKGMPRKGQ